MFSTLRISHPSQEGRFSVSKWVKHQVLLDSKEMEELFLYLAPVSLFNVSEVVSFADLEIGVQQFLQIYHQYVETLKKGTLPTDLPLRRYFSSALSSSPEALYAYEIQSGKYMAKSTKPLVQMQPHRFFPSKATGTILPMVMSEESIHWGVQFSYPQIFHDASQGTYTKVSDTSLFPNTALFYQLIKWLRCSTSPTTFIWDNKKIGTSLRLGKNCFKWIQSHPQMQYHGIQVHVY